MPRNLFAWVGILLIASCAPVALGQANAPNSVLTNASIASMAKAGLSADIITAKIESSKCNFDTSPAALEQLKAAGVPNSVILVMVQHPGLPDTEPNPKEAPAVSTAKPTVAKQPPESAGPGPSASANPTSPMVEEKTKAPAKAASKGCIAVQPIGSHAFRNILLGGIAGALISKQQYKVVDAVSYPARIGQKFHGNDLQTIQRDGAKVVVLPKHFTSSELHDACR